MVAGSNPAGGANTNNLLHWSRAGFDGIITAWLPQSVTAPLKTALANVQVWITGLRAEHSPGRHDMQLLEWDDANQLVKFNPLINWSSEDVKAAIRKNEIPYNVLHDRGFPSIGCAPCTRAVQPGEDFRAGRWWWEQNSKKECGLHERN